MKEDDLVHAASETDGPPNGQLNAVQIEELIEMHEQAAADALQIFASSGGDSVKYFGERSAKTASALRFLLQEREWKPIETAPKDGTFVICFWPSLDEDRQHPSRIAAASWCSPDRMFAKHWAIEGRWTPGDEPTHWKPLPSTPQRQGDRPEIPNDGDTRETNGPQL